VSENEHEHQPAKTAGAKPKNLGFMVCWLVFLGVYQILRASRFGTSFEDTRGAEARRYVRT